MSKESDSTQDWSSAGLAWIVFMHKPTYLKCPLNDELQTVSGDILCQKKKAYKGG